MLAVAGMIFVMVFIAIPALQRNERNAQRKRDMTRIMAAVIEYQKNNGNKNPFLPISDNITDRGIEKFNRFITHYIDPECQGVDRTKRTFYIPESCGSGFTDPDGTVYGIDARADTHTGNKKRERIKFLDRNSKNVGLTGTDKNSYNTTHLIVVFTEAKCAPEEGWVEWVKGKNNIAMWYPLEGGSVICLDNQ